MATKAALKDAIEKWLKHCEIIQTATVVNTAETAQDKLARIKRVRIDYAAFVEYYFPHYTVNPETGENTPCAPFHINAANKVLKESNLKAVFKWHRGAAKSTHLDIFIPLWLMIHRMPQSMGHERRECLYKDAVQWLRDVQNSKASPDLPTYTGSNGEPDSHNPVRYGSMPPNKYDY